MLVAIGNLPGSLARRCGSPEEACEGRVISTLEGLGSALGRPVATSGLQRKSGASAAVMTVSRNLLCLPFDFAAAAVAGNRP